MRLHFVDVDPRVVRALRDDFGEYPEVTISEGDILHVAHDTVVSPANGLGLMDGCGIDESYIDRFGNSIQDRARDAIARRSEGCLPIGAGVLIDTGDAQIPRMIVVSAMDTPGSVDAAHAFFAMSGVLRTAKLHAGVVSDVYCPGLATGLGGVRAEAASREMKRAYAEWRATGE